MAGFAFAFLTFSISVMVFFLLWSFHSPSVLPLGFWAVLSILPPPSKPVLLGRAPCFVHLSSSTSHRDLFKVEKIYLVNLDSEMSLTVYQLNVLLLGATFILGDENKYNQENRRILVTSVQLVYKSLLVTLISQPKGSLLFYSWRVGLRAANWKHLCEGIKQPAQEFHTGEDMESCKKWWAWAGGCCDKTCAPSGQHGGLVDDLHLEGLWSGKGE